ncbi:MAG: two-component sensor histidine kinase [Rhodospirillaceae bacterium]|nr:two-component sensor histidine kinase [Rhodospirillaceae bacterium]|tara:strand:- start:19923 stop:21038 length:1116 start_codon:yes stop_codon:yes gene_type:complete
MATTLQLVDKNAELEEINILGALAFPILVVNSENQISYVNAATEQFLEQGKSLLTGFPLDQVFSKHSPILSLAEQVRANSISVFEHDIDLSSARGGTRRISVQASPMLDRPGSVVLSFHSHGAARSMERQLVHRGAARSVTAMASMLAHEVKNPLSGIRGAAQLLESAVNIEDQSLAQLIKDEADRICKLVDRIGVFGDEGPPDREEVNIHEVLDRVHQLTSAEFSENVAILTDYDPSLPAILANKDQLIQVFLNLVKNAVEAMPNQKGEIRLTTGFRRGVRLTIPSSPERVHLPIMISVTDNGNGIPDDITQNIFDPFVTTKSGGTGLGLALVAKLVHDHGGVVEFETDNEGTSFKLYFPMLGASGGGPN